MFLGFLRSRFMSITNYLDLYTSCKKVIISTYYESLYLHTIKLSLMFLLDNGYIGVPWGNDDTNERIKVCLSYISNRALQLAVFTHSQILLLISVTSFLKELISSKLDIFEILFTGNPILTYTYLLNLECMLKDSTIHTSDFVIFGWILNLLVKSCINVYLLVWMILIFSKTTPSIIRIKWISYMKFLSTKEVVTPSILT